MRASRQLDDVGKHLAPVVLAFSSDPFVRWMFPAPSDFLEYFGRLTVAHATRVAPLGGAFGRIDARAAAFWYPPGAGPDPAVLGAIFQDAGIGERVSAIWEAVDEYEPAEPHWYLRQIGVDPTAQGLGFGGELMEVSLEAIDARGDLAYLEATTEAGTRLYERHGFQLLGRVQAGGSPPLWPMLRPRAS